ncbi:NAD(P)/FAD-dependent oxidoreductase [Bacillus sp. NTK071]|uniref:NAD(P)/FAD-dependent oxidoreductase n=1 Tax=Bacillus sp. NTK071 TaxID=2802175 RepID=UPI001A8EDE20|nr:FAD-dependent oxidoreductase [Bacillus sp. NTK071]MBN8210556.1 NAD(P)/FAD-dependent oxidoreductase [Bacillus sp. NTK071]
MKKIVVVGMGMAAIRFVENLLSVKTVHFEILIIGKENNPAYKRHLLTRVLQGEFGIEESIIHDKNWYESNGIRCLMNEKVVAVDSESQEVKTDRGRKVRYDYLVMATGSTPHYLPVKGAGKKGVVTLRTIDDCHHLIEKAHQYKKAVVIGAGILGLETAMGLVSLGVETTVIHHQPNVMNRQLDRLAAEMLQEALEARGVRFLLNKRTKELIGQSSVEGIRFSDGNSLESDLVLMSVGIRPNIELAKKAGLDVHRGVIVNDHLQTSVPNIFAIGECIEHREVTYGGIDPIYEQADYLARLMTGIQVNGYMGSTVSTHLHIKGIKAFSCGQVLETEETRTFQWIDPIRHIYKKIVTFNGRVIGAILFGDTSESKRIATLVEEWAPVSEIPSNHLFHTKDVNSQPHLKIVTNKQPSRVSQHHS